MKRKLTIGLLKAVAALPLGLLYCISDFIYLIVYHLLGYRRKVVRRNLMEAFPEKSEAEIREIEKEYYHYMCDIIVETVKLLNISDEEMSRRVRIEGADKVNAAVAEGRSAVLMLGHYGNWEWVQEISKAVADDAFKASIYHPLKSKLWEDVYSRIRSRWNAHIIPQANAVRALLKKENQPWVCGFIADHRPRHVAQTNITPFLNHATSFIYGPEVIGNKLGCEFFFLEMERTKRGYYNIIFHPLEKLEGEEPYPVTRRFWQKFEEVIRKNPAYWLWSHKRWKNDKVLTPREC